MEKEHSNDFCFNSDTTIVALTIFNVDFSHNSRNILISLQSSRCSCLLRYLGSKLLISKLISQLADHTYLRPKSETYGPTTMNLLRLLTMIDFLDTSPTGLSTRSNYQGAFSPLYNWLPSTKMLRNTPLSSFVDL